jgi:lipopolysaccharide export system protein LptA
MKFLFGLLLCVASLFGASEKLIIDSKHFEADDAKGLSIFTGNVKLKKVKDTLNSDRLEVYMEPNTKGKKGRKPIKYIAIGNVDFEVYSNGKHYKGKGNKVIYDPNTSEYTVIGKGYLHEVTENRELYGEKIFVNKITGRAKVNGTEDKPVRFIINIDNGK